MASAALGKLSAKQNLVLPNFAFPNLSIVGVSLKTERVRICSGGQPGRFGVTLTLVLLILIFARMEFDISMLNVPWSGKDSIAFAPIKLWCCVRAFVLVHTYIHTWEGVL